MAAALNRRLSGSGGDNPPVRRGYLWRCSLVSALLIGAAVPPTAAAAEPLGLSDCEAMRGLQVCSGLVPTWDGVPLDTTVTLPAPAARKLPLVVEIHGFGNSKYEYLDPASAAYTDNAFAWARRGYAVLTYTARGLWGSCGTPDSRLANPAACARGYIHLADTRYEVRDTQTLIGRLVDEGIADPRRIGVTGDSYGGGQSMALAALSDRMMLPDGRLVAWRSPGGTRLRIAAAAPVIPWTDLIGAIAPNGRDALLRDRAIARDRRSGRGLQGLCRQRDLCRGAICDRAGAAGRGAVRAREADGIPRPSRPRPRRRRHRLGGPRGRGRAL